MKFKVWCPEDGGTEDDATVIEAPTPECAAERWAEYDDARSADYLIVSGRSEPEVCVRDDAGNAWRFRLTGESVPSYTAHAVPAS